MLYCDDHGDALCERCMDPASALPSYRVYRGSLIALLIGSIFAVWLLVRPGGEVRWIAWTARVHFSGQGANRRAQRVVGVCLDLTERKRIETALVDEKSAIAMQLAAIVASSEDAMISAATDGVVTTWNAAAERMFGFTAKEMIGASLGSICPPDLAQEPMSVMERLAAGERPAPYETTRLGKDGRSIDVLISVSALRDSSRRKKGRKTSSYLSGGMPGPSSSIAISTEVRPRTA